MKTVFASVSSCMVPIACAILFASTPLLRAALPVVAWGDNNLGQTMVPDSTSNAVAIAAGGGHNLAIKADGTLAAWGFNFYGQADVPTGLANVVDITAGFDHSVAVSSDGSVTAWGRNHRNQTDLPAGLGNVVQVSANQDYTLALKADRTVVAWGSSDYGQLNLPEGLSNVSAVSAGVTHSLALLNDGTVLGWGLNGSGQATPPAGLTGVVAIAAGGEHSLALKNDGTVVAWGANGFGQTTLPPDLNNVVAVAAGYAHSMALLANGTVVAWGWDAFGQATVPPDLTGVGAISAGFQHSLALILSNAPPAIVCPADKILSCADCNLDPANTGTATATDDGPVTVTYADLVSGDCPKVVSRTWLATDQRGQTASCVQTITCMPATICAAEVGPAECLLSFQHGTNVLALALDARRKVCLTLQGSSASAGQQLLWFDNGQPIGAGARITHCFPRGCHNITMIAADTTTATCTTNLALCVITPSEAVEQCIASLERMDIERRYKRPLIITLKVAKVAFDRYGWPAGVYMLSIFKYKVQSQIAALYPLEAGILIECANDIINAIECVLTNTPRPSDDDDDHDDDDD